MLFNSLVFAVFIVILWVAYWARRSHLWRQTLLLVASLIFYGWWDWRYLSLMVGVSAVAWLTARLYAQAQLVGKMNRAAWLLRLGVGLPLLVLVFFKYTMFAFAAVGDLAALIGVHLPLPKPSILLPVGISFYTFQALSYMVDVARGNCAVERSFARVLLYISFFPQLVAGPIVNATDFLPQLLTARVFSAAQFINGLRTMLMGLLIKVVFADALALWAAPVFDNPMSYTLAARWVGALAFYGQIYFDFAGYSLIAIGAASTFGYTLRQNFNVPYQSLSVTEFWRRWHISLSTWLRDYLFIPLGGNRSHLYRNLMLTMLLGGLWHGASWNFLLWGALHGAALCLHKLWSRSAAGIALQSRLAMAPAASLTWAGLAWLTTQAFVLLCWVPFRAADWSQTMAFFTTASYATALSAPACSITWPWLVLPLLADAWMQRRETAAVRADASAQRLPTWALGAAMAALFILVLALGTWESGSFIYFQF